MSTIIYMQEIRVKNQDDHTATSMSLWILMFRHSSAVSYQTYMRNHCTQSRNHGFSSWLSKGLTLLPVNILMGTRYLCTWICCSGPAYIIIEIEIVL